MAIPLGILVANWLFEHREELEELGVNMIIPVPSGEERVIEVGFDHISEILKVVQGLVDFIEIKFVLTRVRGVRLWGSVANIFTTKNGGEKMQTYANLQETLLQLFAKTGLHLSKPLRAMLASLIVCLPENNKASAYRSTVMRTSWAAYSAFAGFQQEETGDVRSPPKGKTRMTGLFLNSFRSISNHIRRATIEKFIVFIRNLLKPFFDAWKIPAFVSGTAAN